MSHVHRVSFTRLREFGRRWRVVRFCACGAESVERAAWGPWKKIAPRGGRKK